MLGQGLTLQAHTPSVAAKPAPGEPTLAEVRAATERFRDVKVALAEGYLRDPADMCETADMMGKPAALGGMGIHFFRPDMLRNLGTAESARERQRHLYRLPQAGHPDL